MKKIYKGNDIDRVVWNLVKDRANKKFNDDVKEYIKVIDRLNKAPVKKDLDYAIKNINLLEEYGEKIYAIRDLINEEDVLKLLAELYISCKIIIVRAKRLMTEYRFRMTKWDEFKEILKEYDAYSKIENLDELINELTSIAELKINAKYKITKDKYEFLENEIKRVQEEIKDIDIYLYYRSSQEFARVSKLMKSHVAKEEEQDEVNYGKKLKDIRESRGLALKEVAEKTGYSISYIHRLENGERKFTSQVAIELAKALDVPINTFYKFDELLVGNLGDKIALEEVLTRKDYTINGKKVYNDEREDLSNILNTIVYLKDNYKGASDLQKLNSEDLNKFTSAILSYINK
ncbi:helix-turn-helix domain-containing protein [Clostridium perfringens]|uniref:helix-turn-helix domain-containing protein n=1 Tax=Clostridium perfringens TaxID=1502 RepID=UPI0018971632|nr:helix-turn-helix transcriptional regulator [Clostridium perfringens]